MGFQVVTHRLYTGGGAVGKKLALPPMAGQGIHVPPAIVIPAGFPTWSNTGYAAEPNYPGSLADGSTTSIVSGGTYSYLNFPAGAYVGGPGNFLSNVTFIGCRFASNAVDDAASAVYGDNITYDYCTFEPSTVPMGSEPTSYTATKIAHDSGYQYAIDQRAGSGALTVDHCDFWGFAEAIQFGFSTQAKPVTIRRSFFHNERDDGGADHTDGILENYGNLSYVTIDNITVVGSGNTNAVGLQGDGYDHCSLINSYLAGYDYTVHFGNTTSTNMTLTDNTFGTEFQPWWNPLVGPNPFEQSGKGNYWQRNKIHVVPGTTWMDAASDGKFYWPSDQWGGQYGNAGLVGHDTDYVNP